MKKNKKWLWIFVQPLIFVAVLWLIYAADVFFNLNLYKYSLVPRNLTQWWGIFTFPLIHGSVEHVAGNTWSLFVLLAGVRYFFPKIFTKVFLLSYILPGILTWFIARPSYHLGASGMVYALVAFLFVSGVLRFNRYLMAMSLLVVFLYGQLFWGMFPIEEGISWEGHVGGAVAGIIIAILYRKIEPTSLVKEKEYFVDEHPDEEDPLIGDLWKDPKDRKPQEPPTIPQQFFRYIIKKKEDNHDHED